MASDSFTRTLLAKLCAAEPEEATGESNGIHQLNSGLGLGLGFPHPVVQESSDPYTDCITLTVHVVLHGAEALRVVFDRLCSTEKRHDPLTLMDGVGRIVAIRCGRDWADWSQEVRVQGNELRWRLTSDGSVNGWGWRFTVYPVISPGAAANGEAESERLLLARPFHFSCGLTSRPSHEAHAPGIRIWQQRRLQIGHGSCRKRPAKFFG